MERSKVSALTDYLKAIDAVIEQWEPSNRQLTPWFRGVKGTTDELLPALYRGHFASLDRHDEAALMQEFNRVAPSCEKACRTTRATSTGSRSHNITASPRGCSTGPNRRSQRCSLRSSRRTNASHRRSPASGCSTRIG